MAIKRYYAKKDNTITNAFKENLTTRGTGSNMGASDILEVFSIFGQANSSSAEESRVLIKFDCTASTDSIKADRDAGILPISGSVNFFLRLYNAPHSQTLPKSYTMDVSAISGSWNEGTGIDMEGYKDVGASNWINGTLNPTAATMTLVASNALNSRNGTTITLTNTDGTAVTFTTDNTKTETQSTATLIGTSGVSTLAKAVTSVHNALSAAITAGTLKMSISTLDVSSGNITLTQSVAGTAGNTTKPANITGITFAANFAGGAGTEWILTGGDYFTDASSSFTASFDSGVEDIELDITPLVEQWLSSSNLGQKEDEGVGVFLSSEYSSASRSYYTKKFFARGTEFFYKQPNIEARWDSSIEDDRGNFFYSSSLATATENLNTIFFYNYFRGRLRNIPDIGTGNIGVSIFSSSAGSPAGPAISLVADGTHVLSTGVFAVTGGQVSTGIYSASFAMTAASTPLTTINDVWFKLDNSVADASTGVQYGTGTIEPKVVTNLYNAPSSEYLVTITNLRQKYRPEETARFRVYTRQKDWTPTIYTKAVSAPETEVVESGSFEVFRVIDDLKVIPHGTGSTPYHTFMSYDVSGSYFDLDMGLFQPGFMHGIKLAFYNEDIDSWVEQPEVFKFKVE
jgi:hypothetical protein